MACTDRRPLVDLPCIVAGLLMMGTAVLSGCTTSEVLIAHGIELARAPGDLPEGELLDVGIVTFDPGVPEGEIDERTLDELLEGGTFVHIRRTESVYMAVQLRDTLQRSGYWGGVWVTPQESTAADVNIAARILQSDGAVVRIRVTAVDATGRTWIDAPYELETPAGIYNVQRYPHLDPYQDLFNRIANDLAAARAALPATRAREIRTVGALRYAGELAPAAFGAHVGKDRGGAYEPLHLPAAGDPTFNRIERVRQRERLFLDTQNLHYEAFTSAAAPSYRAWRQAAREESIAIRELTRSARSRKALGVAAMIASIAGSLNGGANSASVRIVRDSMMVLGVGMLGMGTAREQERSLHTTAFEELSKSFDDEVKPLVVDIGGIQHRLTGTAEEQYAQWRDLLHQLFIDETGFEPKSTEKSSEAD